GVGTCRRHATHRRARLEHRVRRACGRLGPGGGRRGDSCRRWRRQAPDHVPRRHSRGSSHRRRDGAPPPHQRCRRLVVSERTYRLTNRHRGTALFGLRLPQVVIGAVAGAIVVVLFTRGSTLTTASAVLTGAVGGWTAFGTWHRRPVYE